MKTKETIVNGKEGQSVDYGVIYNCETPIPTDDKRIVHMHYYLDFLALKQKVVDFDQNDFGWEEIDVKELFSDIERIVMYLNGVVAESGVENMVPHCNIDDITEKIEHLPLFLYMYIKLDAMQTAFDRLAIVIGKSDFRKVMQSIKAVCDFIPD